MIQITIAVPVALIEQANQLARCIGYTEADGLTFTLAPQIGGYAVASGLVHEAFLTNAFLPLTEPEWGADMDAAAEAQAAVTLLSPDEDGAWPDPPEGAILAAVGIDGAQWINTVLTGGDG